MPDSLNEALCISVEVPTHYKETYESIMQDVDARHATVSDYTRFIEALGQAAIWGAVTKDYEYGYMLADIRDTFLDIDDSAPDHLFDNVVQRLSDLSFEVLGEIHDATDYSSVECEIIEAGWMYAHYSERSNILIIDVTKPQMENDDDIQA